MSTATERAYRSNFTGQFMPSVSRKSPEIKPFHGYRGTSFGKVHCIKDSVLLDETCGSGESLVGTNKNSEVIWSEQRSV